VVEEVEAYYMCVYLRDGKPIGHEGKPKNDFPASLEDAGKKPAEPKILPSGMEVISDQFISAMMGYLEYVPLILSMAPNVSFRMVVHSLQKFLEENCVSCERTPERVVYKFNLDQYPNVKRFQENMDAARSTSLALPRLLTVGLVTTLEYHLNLTMKEIASKFPERIFEREKTISVSKAVKFSSMQELKDELVNDEIDKVQRENFETQVKWVIEKTGMSDFTDSYPDWPNIIELLERRNLFVHANGAVNDYYLKAASKYGFNKKGGSPVLGQELHAGPAYYSSSVSLVLHFGLMLLQIAWRKMSPDQSETADRCVSELGYELIGRGRHKLAIRILEFARQLRGVSEIRKRMNIVNLANAYKLSGDSQKSIDTLSEMDWTAVSFAFKISVAAVKGEVDEVCELMKRIGSEGEVTAQDYRGWPVFYGVRENPKFIAAFKTLFGIEYVAAAKAQAGVGQVIEWMRKLPDDETKDEEMEEDEQIEEPSPTLQPGGGDGKSDPE
jgi:hypothetical protein